MLWRQGFFLVSFLFGDRLMNIIDRLEQQIKHRKQLAEDLMQTVLRDAFEY
jgi:hypothetical protein